MTREEAINILGNFKRYISGGGVTDRKANEAIDIAIEALEEIPKRRKEAKRWKTKALQAEPVKHGEWKYYNYSDINNPYVGFYECTVCNQHEHIKHKFCPHCGAKMDK